MFSEVPLAPQLVREMVDKLGADYAANPTLGTAAEKITGLLGAMVAKCVLCVSQADGRGYLSQVADCADDDCPLNPYGPGAFKMVRAKLEFQGGVAGGVQ
jgi:hypothetical protein